jgi:leucyl-tRNA synthetase
MVEEKAGKNSETDLESQRLLNGLVKKAGSDLKEFKFNTVIAKLMETVNGLSRPEAKVSDKDLGNILKVLAPFSPFVAEELWAKLGEQFSIHKEMWPTFDEAKLTSETIVLPVQVNGKLRGTVEVGTEADEDMVVSEAKKNEKIAGYLNNGEIKKVIFIKGRALNFVVV